MGEQKREQLNDAEKQGPQQEECLNVEDEQKKPCVLRKQESKG